MRLRLLFLVAIIFSVTTGMVSLGAFASSKDKNNGIISSLSAIQTLPATIAAIKSPVIKNPDWLQAQLDAEAKVSQYPASSSVTTITYSVTTKGNVTASLSEFKSLANQTLNDARGWARMGVNFQEVSSGGSFTLVLSEASQVPSFAPTVCSVDWSCSVGRYVIINQDRWLNASVAWNNSGGLLRDYRNMVVNHETGHWLGHGHIYTCGTGGKAPVMMQQSISLNGCSFNPWPLDSELWSSMLGIQ